MKYSLFFSSLVLFNAYSLVQCGFNLRASNSVPGPKNPPLALPIPKRGGICTIANITLDEVRQSLIFQDYLFVCPAESEKERKINEERSKTKNTLFIRDTLRNGSSKPAENPTEEKQLGKDKSKSDFKDSENKHFEFSEYYCKNPVEPSVKYGYIPELSNKYGIDFYFVGFEVFVNEEYQELKTLDYTSYVKLNKPDFHWFNVLTIRFDKENGNALSVNAGIRESTISPSSSTRFNEYSLDPKINTLGKEEFYKGEDVEDLYSLKNQQAVFDNLFEDESLRNTYFNIIQERYLVENHLAPLHGFATSTLEKAAHTYGNIAAMWKIIKENSWAKVENKIKFLFKEVSEIHVITGTYETLKLENKEIYLGSKKNIRVPLAFWKIVQHIDVSENFYNMLIVTINNPYEEVSIDLCPISQCKKYGWEYVEQDSHSWGRTLCCKVTTENITLLKLEGNVPVDRILTLRKVPDEEIEIPFPKYTEKYFPVEDVPSSN